MYKPFKTITLRLFLWLCFAFFSGHTFAQGFIRDTTKRIIAKFDTIPYTLKEGQIISKTLRIDNKGTQPLTFSVEVAYPPAWRTLSSRARQYTIETGDSIFIPVRIIPFGKIRGNTRYLINAYVLEKDSTPVAAASFYVIREKVSTWQLTVEPTDKIYFLNKENTSEFQIGIINTGNEDQELLLDFENYRDKLLIMDTTEKIITKVLTPLTLKPNQDTTFKYKVKYMNGLRNFRMIDMDSHKPNTEKESKTYSLYAKTSEPKAKQASALQKTKRVDFVKLGDEYKANPFGYNYIPLIFDANVTNILGGQPIMNVNLRGSTFLENGATLNYFSQLFFSNNYYSNQYLLSSAYYIGYYDQKYQIDFGDIAGLGAGGYSSAGRGLAVKYRIDKEHLVGASYTKSPRLFEAPQREAYGAMYNYTPVFGNFIFGYTRNIQSRLALTSNFFNVNSSFRLPKSQSATFGIVLSNHNSGLAGNTFTRNGYIANTGYSGTFLSNRRLRVNTNVVYMSKWFDPYNDGEMWSANLNGSYTINKKLTLQGNSFYNKREVFYISRGLPNYTYTNYRNALSIGMRNQDNYITPGLFYNINTINDQSYHSRGINLNFGNYNYETNRLLSNALLAGYNRIIGAQPLRDYFFFQYFFLFRYKTISANLRYNYGTLSGINASLIGRSPQSFGAAINYQYQFKNPHFIMQNYLSYSYYDFLKRHTINYSPVLYYYSDSGWRLHLGLNYNSARTDASGERLDASASGLVLPDSEPVVTRGINALFGVRKEFGIPIPYSKKKYFDVDFIAFIDLNGNRKKDGNEYTLENVVIGLNKMEVLTNTKGKASIKNLPMDKYLIYSFSLVELDGYYPYLDEEIEITKNRTDTSVVYIPFVKGIKIFGKIVVERETAAKNLEMPLDLSGIKISALNGKTIHTLTERDGSFSFYVPYGKFMLNMDETVLGDRFTLLQNNIELVLDRNTENVFITFFVVEARRKIISKRFDANGNLIDPNTGGAPGSPGSQGPLVDRVAQANAEAAKVRPIPNWDVAKDALLKNFEDVTKSQGLIYTVQIGAFQKPLNPKVFDGMKQISYERIDKNFVRICAGKFDSEGAATLEKDNLVRVGFPGAYVTAYYDGKLISLEEAAKIKNK